MDKSDIFIIVIMLLLTLSILAYSLIKEVSDRKQANYDLLAKRVTVLESRKDQINYVEHATMYTYTDGGKVIIEAKE
jgi:hypothetical protein